MDYLKNNNEEIINQLISQMETIENLNEKVNNNMMSKEDININILNDEKECGYIKDANILLILLFILAFVIIYNNQV